MLFLIETVPKLMGNNYVQSVLPKFIAVAGMFSPWITVQ